MFTTCVTTNTSTLAEGLIYIQIVFTFHAFNCFPLKNSAPTQTENNGLFAVRKRYPRVRH